jgi:precorrin-6A/cobalt-precorrin-6A reductase
MSRVAAALPTDRLRLLILGGSAEARVLAEALSDRPDIAATVSLAGVTRDPRPLPLHTRIGGFGGAAAQADWIEAQRIEAVIDASHPFAARIGPRTAALCAARGLPFLRLLRPGWVAGSGDRWTCIARPEDAAPLIPEDARVFLAVGRQSLPEFAGLAGRALWCRIVDPPGQPFPWPNGTWEIGRPPFAAADEVALFRRLCIDWLVAKDAGGAGGRAKLDAARCLGLQVALLDRPMPPPGPIVATVAEALDWLDQVTAGRPVPR